MGNCCSSTDYDIFEGNHRLFGRMGPIYKEHNEFEIDNNYKIMKINDKWYMIEKIIMNNIEFYKASLVTRAHRFIAFMVFKSTSVGRCICNKPSKCFTAHKLKETKYWCGKDVCFNKMFNESNYEIFDSHSEYQ